MNTGIKPSKSPERNSFQKEKYIQRCEEKGQEPSQDYLEMFENIIAEDIKKFDDPKSRENSMEWDLLTTDWILAKVRSTENYAQNLYAAMCNNDFQKLAVVPILKEEHWGCSWRYAGGIVADMRQEGDYIDWYCSGIRDRDPPTDTEESKWTEEQKIKWETVFKHYVPEGLITEEIREDLQKLGWVPVKGGDWEKFDDN